MDTTADPDENCIPNSCNSARTQKGPKKREDKKRDITKENQFDTDGIYAPLFFVSQTYIKIHV